MTAGELELLEGVHAELSQLRDRLPACAGACAEICWIWIRLQDLIEPLDGIICEAQALVEERERRNSTTQFYEAD